MVCHAELAELIVALQVCFLISLSGPHVMPEVVDFKFPMNKHLLVKGVHLSRMLLQAKRRVLDDFISGFFLFKEDSLLLLLGISFLEVGV